MSQVPDTAPSYGIDRPGRVVGLFASACFFVILGLFLAAGAKSSAAATIPFVLAALAALAATTAIVTSLAIKPRVWRAALDAADLGSVTTALDAGCGRALVAIEVAHRAPSAAVTGIDAWQPRAQAGNSRIAAELNTRVAGVAGRVTITTGDVRTLDLPDASIDLATASLVLGCLAPADRPRALVELRRVLRPGATLIAVDRSGALPSPAELTAAGFTEQTRSRRLAVPPLTTLTATATS
jgi:SAM-dependent methyltransferase